MKAIEILEFSNKMLEDTIKVLKYKNKELTEQLSIQGVGSSCLWIVQDKENNILYTSFKKSKAIEERIKLIDKHKVTLDVNKMLVD